MNAPLDWKDSYSVGVKVIDEQHKRLFTWINDLFAAAKDSKSNEVLEETIRHLLDYVVFHFGTEEKYFEEFEYFNKAEHKDEHRQYTEKIKEFAEEYKTNADPAFSDKVLDFLEGWIIGHVLTTDKKYTKCFNDHGLN